MHRREDIIDMAEELEREPDKNGIESEEDITLAGSSTELHHHKNSSASSSSGSSDGSSKMMGDSISSDHNHIHHHSHHPLQSHVSHHRSQPHHARNNSDLSTTVPMPEVFVFDYGTVVIWGMSPPQERRFLAEMSKFAETPLPPESAQTEDFNFYYTREYQARIYNDFISLREPNNYMIKLAISHALAQSVKTSLFEDLVSDTIEDTSPLPALIAQTGSVDLTRRQLNMKIGELFILRINVHLQGSVLDSPELMWAEPHLEPVYAAVRSYLEIGQRVGLLTDRLDVIADLLAVLREQGSRKHGEVLEWIGASCFFCLSLFFFFFLFFFENRASLFPFSIPYSHYNFSFRHHCTSSFLPSSLVLRFKSDDPLNPVPPPSSVDIFFLSSSSSTALPIPSLMLWTYA